MLLIIEPFYGGSHRVLVDQLMSQFKDSSLLYTLPAKKWHWRARTSASYFYKTIPLQNSTENLILFCSSVLNLAELCGLRPDLAKAKKIIYFHENQLEYPVNSPKGDRDFQFGYNQIVSCLAADFVCFNSEYNKTSFLTSIDSFLRLQPDFRVSGLVKDIEPKTRVLYFPIDYSLIVPRSIETRPPVLSILWSHRWEHDKNPECFFNTLLALKEGGFNFHVYVLGESFQQVPPIFLEAKEFLKDYIQHWGYLESKDEYYQLLSSKIDVIVSTSIHEFFGVSVLEAVAAGAYPLLPKRLVYPELFSEEFLYSTDRQLFKRLKKFCSYPKAIRSFDVASKLDVFKYDLENFMKKFFAILS